MTIEPTPDDSYVYEKAWPLVREWRMLRRNHPAEGRTLSWMQRRERLLKVEIALLNEHRLTLPPDAQPIDDQWRRHVTNWRTQRSAAWSGGGLSVGSCSDGSAGWPRLDCGGARRRKAGFSRRKFLQTD